jgi:hypothetical protein
VDAPKASPLDQLLDALADRVAARLARPADRSAADGFVAVRDLPERRSVVAAIRRGELPAFKPTKKVLVRRADYTAWIERHPVAPNPDRGSIRGAATDPIARMVAAGKLRRIG